MSKGQATDYGGVAKLVHWLAALCVLLAWLLGIAGDAFPKSLEAKALFVHMSLGLAILALLVLRIGAQLVRPAPELPTALGGWSEWLAVATQFLLYGLMLAAIASGVALEFARGQPLPLFGLGEIASPWVRNRAFVHRVKEVHESLAHALLLLASLHAAAALFHHFILKDRTLVRMLPRRH